MNLFKEIFGRDKKPEQNTDNSVLMNANDIWYTTPTISNEFPQTVPLSKETEFDITVHEDDYRQYEFLNPESLPKIQEEFIRIKEIWTNHSKKSDTYTLFKNCHVREKVGSPDLKINFSDLKTFLKCNSVGQVIINGEILENGFALKTGNTAYFGVHNDETVTELCISKWNDKTKNEILEINKRFNLLFVNWYHSDLIENA